MISDDNVSSFELQIANLIKIGLRLQLLLNTDKPNWHGICTYFFQMDYIPLPLQYASVLSS